VHGDGWERKPCGGEALQKRCCQWTSPGELAGDMYYYHNDNHHHNDDNNNNNNDDNNNDDDNDNNTAVPVLVP